MRPLKNANFCSSSRKAKILTTGIPGVFRGLKFEPDTEIGQKGAFCKGLKMLMMVLKRNKFSNISQFLLQRGRGHVNYNLLELNSFFFEFNYRWLSKKVYPPLAAP